MTFWNWRRGNGAVTSGSAAMAMAPDLAPIELYTAESRIVGWIAANGRRVTDLLNDQDELRIAPEPRPDRGLPHRPRPTTRPPTTPMSPASGSR